jgi:translation initiation factor 1
MSTRKAGAGGLVYSTEGGRMCPVCRHAIAACVCAARSAPSGSGDGVVRVSRESKGRGGKTVTVVRGVALDAASMTALGKRLRGTCGAGGTLKDGVLEVQGDHADRVVELLRAEGFVVKRAGG